MILNVIDGRRRRYRWKSVNAIAEPTWHDNAAPDSDETGPVHGESEHEERKQLSVADAIAWAQTLPFPVTLYLYDSDKEPPR